MENVGERAGAFERAIDLLQAILNDRGKSRIGTIASSSNVPLSSAHRLVALLERRGILVRFERGRYLPGLALVSCLPNGALDLALTATGRPMLKRLAIETGYTAHLGVLRSDMVTYLIKESAPGGHIFTRETMQLEAYCSGVGKMLLSQLPKDALAAYLRQDEFIALTDRTITDPDLLRSHLDLVRSREYAVDDGEMSDGIRCVSVPIRATDGRAIAAISIASNSSISEQTSSLLNKLRVVAASIENSMRY
jgi:IclR family transcriptional regulator, acetate operon repressor